MDHQSWDERYAASDLVWSADPSQFLPPVADSLTPGTALDVACGEGRNAIWLALQGWHVTAVDFSPVGIEKGRTIAGRDLDIEWVVEDVTSFEAPSSFDLVIIFYLHLSPTAFAESMRRAVDAVSPGGTLFCVGHSLRNMVDGIGGPQFPEILWTPQTFEPLLGDFEMLELGERFRPVEGSPIDAIDIVVHARRPA
jgi:SAM-dependent methyltransferase